MPLWYAPSLEWFGNSLQLDSNIGTCRFGGVPVFISAPLSGADALDAESLLRLQWHILLVLQWEILPELERLREEKNQFVKSGQYEKAAAVRNLERLLMMRLGMLQGAGGGCEQSLPFAFFAPSQRKGRNTLTMSQRILSNDRLDRSLLKEGYVVVPFLDADAVRELKAFFLENHPQGVNGFYATAHSPDTAFRQRMNDRIMEAFRSPIEKYFTGCRPLGGSFVVKSKENTSRLHPHQDWNIVDEDRFRSFNIWVPLVDLTGKNGAIRVMPGSHRWVRNFRGPNIPDAFENIRENIWEKMRPLHMRAGEALIYDHRLFHASDPNTTDELRVAAVFGIIPEEAQMFYYFGRDGKVEVYESSVEFFMTGDIQKGPELLKHIGNEEHGHPEQWSPLRLALMRMRHWFR